MGLPPHNPSSLFSPNALTGEVNPPYALGETKLSRGEAAPARARSVVPYGLHIFVFFAAPLGTKAGCAHNPKCGARILKVSSQEPE